MSRIQPIDPEEAMMTAAFYEQQGAARDVFKVAKTKRPVPGRGEVMVRVAVSGLNPSDVRVRTGFLGPMAFERIIPHQDAAGTIVEVGEGVDAARINERVWVYQAQYGNSSGTAAEYVVVPSQQAVFLPEKVTFEVGACLGIAAMTACHCLFADGDIRGLNVLVHGGAGAVGEAAVQIARYSGAWVAATIRNPDDAQKVRSKGADLVIDMSSQHVAQEISKATDGKGVDRIVEIDLLSNLKIDLDVLSSSGTISTYSLKEADDHVLVPVFRAMKGNNAFRFVYVYTIPEEAKQKAAKVINACLENGSYDPTIGLIVPLAQISEAHEALESRRVKGKILIRIA